MRITLRKEDDEYVFSADQDITSTKNPRSAGRIMCDNPDLAYVVTGLSPDDIEPLEEGIHDVGGWNTIEDNAYHAFKKWKDENVPPQSIIIDLPPTVTYEKIQDR